MILMGLYVLQIQMGDNKDGLPFANPREKSRNL